MSLGEFWPQSNCVGLWHLNGNSNDVSGTGANGTDTSVTYSLANGKLNQGAGFNGTTSKISLGTNISALKLTSNFTVSAWVKTSASGVNQFIFQTYYNTGFPAGFYFAISSANKLILLSGKKTGSTVNVDYAAATGVTSINDGKWHYVVGTWDGSALRVYVDGNLETSTSWANAPVYDTTSQQRIGNGNQSGTETNFFNGAIDEVAVFNRALTDQEIRRWYAWSVGKYL